MIGFLIGTLVARRGHALRIDWRLQIVARDARDSLLDVPQSRSTTPVDNAAEGDLGGAGPFPERGTAPEPSDPGPFSGGDAN